MKTTVPFKNIYKLVMLALIVVASALDLKAQSGSGSNSGPGSGTTVNLTFKNPSLISGTAGNDGAVYRFPNADNNIDALVQIYARSSSLVKLVNIDVSNTGYDKAFQPQVTYNNGSTSFANSWWMDFKVTFVNKNTTTPVALNTVYATALDLDGDNGRLHERVSFYSPNAYTLENPTNLSVSNLVQTILGILTNVGKTFDGVTIDHSGVDTVATTLMATMTYNNATSLIYRAGAATTGSSNGTERNYSVYFKNFKYTAPIVSLPVKLASFTAMLSQDQNKVNLDWVTASEDNVSHFSIEKSFDGKSFSDAGLVFAFGNTSEKMNYRFADNVKNSTHSIIYYRLRSVDNDGKSELSEIRIIRLGHQDEAVKLTTYPNPVTNELRLTLPNNWQNKPVVIEMFNQAGQRMKSSSISNASQTETLVVNDMTKGFYVVRATCGTETAQQKIVKN